MVGGIPCKICGRRKASKILEVCKKCIRQKPLISQPFLESVHAKLREKIGLPPCPPRVIGGVVCEICGNFCRIGVNGIGYCGLTQNKDGKLYRSVGNKNVGLVYMYKDWHPTNCVSVNWCAGGSGAGYPKYAKRDGTEIGFANASLFLGTCSYHCLYCQNVDWHSMVKEKIPTMSAEELVKNILGDSSYTCVCWFGGSPEPQSPFVWNVSRLLTKNANSENRILRICLESNGNFSWKWLKRIAKISLRSGGGIKFDLKCAPNSLLNLALSGVPNTTVYRNFEKLINFHQERPEVPFLRASTLLVPYYIDLEEVKNIVKFIASLDKTIPYSLLAFYPHYALSDVGFTSKKFAERCYQIAKKAGLQKVNIGNIHLLK